MWFVVAVGAALGGVAFWRRKTLGSDAEKVSTAARSTVAKVKSGRKELLTELGGHVYAQASGDAEDGVDHEAEAERLVDEIAKLDADADSEDGDEADTSEAPADGAEAV